MIDENRTNEETTTPIDANEEPSISSEAEPPATDSVKALQDEVEKYKKEYLYLRAEFDNYKKNMIKERSDLLKFGSERLAVEALKVMDVFDLALGSDVTAENYSSFVEGMQMTSKELTQALQKVGVEEIICQNQAFDPSFHEALGSEESSAIEPGHIIHVYKKGYTMHKKVIRPAQVIVAKEPST